MKKISVIIPCHNSGKYLGHCLESLEKQTILEELELIFVDDASTDGGVTLSMLTDFEAKHPDQVILVALQENMRQGGARNIGMKYASGKYIALLDSDDSVPEDVYEWLYNTAEEKQCQILQTCHRFIDVESGNSRDDSMDDLDVQLETYEDRVHFIFSQKMSYGCTNKLYLREFLTAHNFAFAEHLVYEEPAFVLPMVFYLERFSSVNHVTYYYEYRRESTTFHDMLEANKVLDNAQASLIWLKDLVSRGLVEEYGFEITYLFFHWYYVSTLAFAGQRELFFDLKEFRKLQQTMNELFPDIRENPYVIAVHTDNMEKILDSLDRELNQEEFEDLCRIVYSGD